jgi:hypothetical protein
MSVHHESRTLGRIIATPSGTMEARDNKDYVKFGLNQQAERLDSEAQFEVAGSLAVSSLH